MVKIDIDLSKCTGCASCNVLYKDVFHYDEKKEHAFIPDTVTNIDLDKAVKVAKECPSKAITVYNEQGEKVFPAS